MQVHRQSNVEVKVIPDSSGYTSDRSSHKISLPMLCPSLFKILATPLHDTLVGSSFGVAVGRMPNVFQGICPQHPTSSSATYIHVYVTILYFISY